MLATFYDAIRRDFEKAAKLHKKNCDDSAYGESCFIYGQYSMIGRGGKPELCVMLILSILVLVKGRYSLICFILTLIQGYTMTMLLNFPNLMVGLHSTVSGVSDSKARGP